MNESWEAGIGGGLWTTGKALACYFRDNKKELEKILRNKSAIELGSGNAFIGMLLSVIVPSAKVFVTDIGEHVQFMEDTLQLNRDQLDFDRISVAEYNWGDAVVPARLGGHSKFDFIFGSDVAYRDYLHSPLVEALKLLSHQGTKILIGVTMHDTSVSFFDKLIENGFRYTRLHDSVMDEEFHGKMSGLFFIERWPKS